MAELNKIKQERAAEAAKQDAERKEREEKIRVENILKGNPLLSKPDVPSSVPATSSEFKVKRRWDDDVVFKNCAKLDEGKKKDFVNDTLRSEFHKKFMERYVK
jgi:protein CWC15